MVIGNARSLGGSAFGSWAPGGHGVNMTLGFRHVVVSSGTDDTCWCVPDEDGTLGAGGYNELLVW